MKGLEEGEEWWGWGRWLRGAARRRREKVCLRLPADSLKTERSILGVKSSVSALEGEGEEEHKERERSSGWEMRRRSTTGIDSRCSWWWWRWSTVAEAMKERERNNGDKTEEFWM